MHSCKLRSWVAVVLLIVFGTSACIEHVGAQSMLPDRKSPWTTSRIKGSPDPPLPFKTVRVFENVELDRPTNVSWLPDAERWIANHAGGKIVTFPNDPVDATAQPWLDLSDAFGSKIGTGYSTLFHPDLKNHPWCFVTFTSKPKTEQGHHLARLKVIDPSVPTVDPNSLTILASWKSHGHVGGAMEFGPDGMLYVSVGDGQPPYPPDGDETGQDLSDLRASILRLDVNDPTDERPYRIPEDNPFVGRADARGEIWAYGFRNPWKIAFDSVSGDLVAADVGWEMREIIHRVKRGRNHGWSLMEGTQPVKQDQQPATEITPPLFEHTHLDSRSISGGHFWQSERIPELMGAYLYGDWMTGKVWALKFEGDRVIWQKELVDTPHRVICFMSDPSGEVLIVGYDGMILRLEPNEQAGKQADFPTQLSDTGLFADVAEQQPAPGVTAYEINARHWADGTVSRQWIAVPGEQQITLFDRSDWKTGQSAGRFEFPSDTVVAKTVSYLTDVHDADSLRHLETQVLHKNGDEWRAYNYIWNEDQTDAVLQADTAVEKKLLITDRNAAGGKRTQTWRHASRSECLLCHIWAAGTVHGFWPEQLSLDLAGENQLEKLTRLGLFAESVSAQESLASPYDEHASLESRARSYLHMNCSTCHRKQGGGTANFDFDITRSLKDNQYLDASPAQGTFGIHDARVVAPGNPYRSVLLYRLLKSGRGHMPQFGSSVIDHEGVQLLHDWIASLPNNSNLADALKSEIDSLKVWKENPAQKVDVMLTAASSALTLATALANDSLQGDLREVVIDRGVSHSDPAIRDLFESFLPEEKRVRRLGATVDEAKLLAAEGSPERGRVLFATAKDVNCRQCHQIGDVGKQIGPDLSGIGTQQTPTEILANILRPSEKIDPKYRARQVLTADGRVLTGIVLSETDDKLTLADNTGKQHEIPDDEIEAVQPAAKSAMPDQLLSGMTPQNAADLIAFLSAQRKIMPLQHKHSVIRRARGKVAIDGRRDEAWSHAEPVGDFVFTWWKDGDGKRQATDARMLWDDDYLYVSFVCEDEDIHATRTGRDSKVYRDDCVEVFASPEFEHPERYFNIEMNAIGEQLDQYRPNGEMLPDWNPDGIRIAVQVDGSVNDPSDVDRSWSLEVAIPFRLFADVLPSGRPEVGDRWRLNLNRLEQEMSVKSQWSQGDRNFPRFHHPEYFGFVEFAE